MNKTVSDTKPPALKPGMIVPIKEVDAKAIAKLQKAYAIFRKVKPLALGTREHLLQEGIPLAVIVAVLSQHTATREYFLACREGAKRYNIRGHVQGSVSADEAAYADERLTMLDAIHGRSSQPTPRGAVSSNIRRTCNHPAPYSRVRTCGPRSKTQN